MKMTLRMLHKRIGEMIEGMDKDPYQKNADKPVTLVIRRKGRKRDWIIPIRYGCSGALTFTDPTTGDEHTVCTLQSNEEDIIKL